MPRRAVAALLGSALELELGRVGVEQRRGEELFPTRRHGTRTPRVPGQPADSLPQHRVTVPRRAVAALLGSALELELGRVGVVVKNVSLKLY